MRKLHFPKLFKKLFNKNKAVWMLTFILSFAFFTLSFSSPSVRAVKEDSAGAIYLIHPDQNGNQEGFMPNLYNSIYRSLTGYATATDVSSDGTVIFERKGGVVTALADIGDSFYENPSGSALIWAQDQINMIAGKGSFKALAYNPNDTDIYYVSGYTALEGTIGLWNWSRNIVYSLFIIILIGVAFMILFRRSLGGQQYVTLTNSLPSIVLSLVLITFSYPISAVFIDMVSIGCNLVYNVIIAAPNAPGHAFLQQMPDSTTGEMMNIQVPKAVEGKITTTVKVSGTPTTVENDGIDVTGETDVKNVLQPDDPQMSIWAIFYTSNAKVCGGMPLGILQLTPGMTGEKCNFSKFLLPAAVYGPFSLTINSLLWALDNLGLGNLIIEIALILLIITTQFKLLKQIIGDYLILSFFPIFAPWIFLVAAMPNRTSKMITDYIKILGLSVFNLVVIYACFLILVVMGYSSNEGTEVEGSSQKFLLGDSFKQMAQIKWVPPMLGYSYGQIVGNTGAGDAGAKIISTIIIIFFYMAIPRVPEELRSWLSIPQIPAILRNTGQDVGNTFKQAGGYIAGGIGSITKKRLSRE